MHACVRAWCRVAPWWGLLLADYIESGVHGNYEKELENAPTMSVVGGNGDISRGSLVRRGRQQVRRESARGLGAGLRQGQAQGRAGQGAARCRAGPLLTPF